MNEVAIQQSNKMAKAAQFHNIPFAVRQINNGALAQQNGVYCIYGINQEDVGSISRLDDAALYKFCNKQEDDLTLAYPQCTVTKITDINNLETAAMILDNFIVFDFLREKAADFGLKINSRVIKNSVLSDIEVAYNESINAKRKPEDRKSFYDVVRKHMEMFHENVSFEEFYKNHSEYDTESTLIHSIKGKVWTSDREYYTDESRLYRPNRTISSTPIEEKYLEEFEDMMNKEEIHYYIDPEAFICNDFGESDLPDDDFYEYMEAKPRKMHTVMFDSKYEGLVNGFKRSKENDFLAKHAKALRYDSDFKYYPFSIPELWIHQVVSVLESLGSKDIIFDVKGTYVPSSYTTFGLIATTQSDAEKIISALKEAMKIQTELKITKPDKERELLGNYREESAKIAQKTVRRIPFFGNKKRDDDAR